MNFKFKKSIFIFFFLFSFLFSFLVFSDFVSAQGANTMLWGNQAGNVATETGLGTDDPRIIIARIINVLLGFLGIIAVLIILYGGWLWMTSNGDSQQIDKAKKVLISAFIGLIIILLSFGIAQFALQKLYNVTVGCTPGDWKVCGCGGMGTQTCNAGGTWDPCFGGACAVGETCCSGTFCAVDCTIPPPFVVTSTSPADGALNMPMNTKIRYKFNLPVNAGTVILGAGGTFHVVDSGGSDIAGGVVVNSKTLEYSPLGACPPNPCGATECLPAGETVTVTADNGILSVAGNTLTCTILDPCKITFTTSNSVDCEKPKVSLDFDQICAISNNELYANSSDDSGVWQLEFFVNDVPIVDNPPVSGPNPVVNPFPAPGSFDTRPLFMPSIFDATIFTPGDTINLKVTAYDVDANTSSDSKNVTLRPDHCCNGILDGDEEAVDCGGSCAACDGAACGTSMNDSCAAGSCSVNNNLCASQFCSCTTPAPGDCQAAGYATGITDCCLCQKAPIIDWITPIGGFCDGVGGENTFCTTENETINCAAFGGVCNTSKANGAGGNLITIGGRYFGSVPGVVRIGGVNANLASVVNPLCISSWSDNQIVVEVPAGLPAGSQTVIVENVAGMQDANNDARGASVDFIVNSIVRPGLCLISPATGQTGDLIQYNGIRLNNNSAFFGNLNANVPALSSVFASNLLGQANVPSITDGKTTTFTTSPAPNFVGSNYLIFKKISDSKSGPRIISFEPTKGSEGQYVTIFGEGFGNNRGSSDVRFGVTSANFDFPEVCSDNLWSDTQIIVKVPALANGNHTIFIDLESGPTIDTTLLSPNAFTFDSTLPLLPSLCKIEPKMGPNNSPVTLYGEYFDSYNNPFSRIRFHLKKDQFGPIIPAPTGPIVSWGLTGDYYTAETLVHPLAVSGPVRVVKGSPEVVGNGLNFKVGECNKEADPDAACGAGNFCCPTGSYNAGQCVIDLDDCNLGFKSSVYEWDFSTDITGGKIGDPCDSDIVAPGCQDSTAMCAPPLECSTKTCTCQPASENSCSGVSLSECALVTFCPNSPGQCSTYPGGEPQKVGSCVFDCEGVGACTAASCSYNSAVDRCEVNGSFCDMTMPAVDILGNPITAYCADYSGTGHWHIDTKMSCPFGWTNIFGGRCVDLSTGCAICSSDFVCVDNACVVNKDICPTGSACINTNECVANDNAACECCCEIKQDARDCCSPLTCEGTCGDDLIDDGSGYGECSGCANAGITQAEHDAACNCSGHVGKFCETTDPDYPQGVCRDCASLSSNTECQAHNTTCCLDAMSSGACRGGDGTLLFGSECSYYNCVPPDNASCNINPVNSGKYDNLADCNTKCVPGPSGLGLSCASTSTSPVASLVCNTTICSSPFECLNAGGGGATPPSNCGFCCCDPTDPLVCGPTLKCNEAAPCDGGGRGLCCGCEDDVDCGNLSMMGCGEDACCRQRPSVIAVVPPDEPPSLPGSGTICRNALISAEFDQPMDPSSFSGNILVIGDYGSNTCPAGTEYLITQKEETYDNLFEFLALKVKKLLRLLPGNFAIAYTNPNPLYHYCAVSGVVTSEVSAVGNGIVKFAPHNALASDTLYYVIIKGDEALNSSKGVLNKWKIGMNGPFNANNTFNTIVYDNSYIWSFRTLPEYVSNDGICLLGSVDLQPYSYLFKTNKNDPKENDINIIDPTFDTVADRDKVFVATAKSLSGQAIVPLIGIYDWMWSWNILDTTVADFAPTNPFPITEDYKRLVFADPDITDGKTMLTTLATIVTGLPGSPTGTSFGDTADIYVFVCENPWPPIVAGIWKPWRDADYATPADCVPLSGSCWNTNYEFYYCRDKGTVGTYDDLPSIASDAVIRGDSNPEILKEAYFLRNAAPVTITVLSAVDSKLGQSLDISWAPPVAGANGYKLYWGKSSGNYSDYKDVGNVGAYTISGLDNNKVYYVNITAYYANGAESDYHGEVSAMPTDGTPPPPPLGLAAAPDIERIDLSWTLDTGGDVVSYKVYYGVDSGNYGGSIDVGFVDSVTVDGLTTGEDYFFVVTASDKYDNESAYSLEVTEIPN